MDYNKEPYKKKCKGCNKEFTPFNTLQKYCGYECHNKNEEPKPKKRYQLPRQRKPINKVSKKQAIVNAKYSADRIKYLSKKENQICFIDGCNRKADTIEHRAGRGLGFFDEWAKENNICKTLDQRYWAPCCLKHNLELENNPELSKKYQLSKLHNGKKY